MFCDAKRCLQVGGEVRIVGNRYLDCHQETQAPVRQLHAGGLEQEVRDPESGEIGARR